MSSGLVKIGIVGTGATVCIGKNHTDAAGNDGRAAVAAVYNRTLARSEEFIKNNGLNAIECGSFKELLAASDAVIICSPNDTHVEYMVRSAEAGKPFMTEKPLSARFSDCDSILAALEMHPVFNMAGFVYRFSELTQRLKRIAEEELGRIYTFTATAGGRRLADPGVPLEWRMESGRAGNGALCDFGSHVFDLALYVFGFSPKTVSCRLGTFIASRPPGAGGKTRVENDDSAAVCGEGQRGELFNVLTSRVGMDEMKICAAGEGGMVTADYSRNTMTFERKRPEGGYTGKVETIDLSEARQEWFDRQMSAFIDGVLGKPADVCTIGQAYSTEKVLDCAALSHSTGRAIEIDY